jgi:ribonuclease VapC
MNNLVLDTSTVLALIFGEKGAAAAMAGGQGGLLSAVSYAEALAKSLDRNAPLETVQQAVDGLRLNIVPFDEAHAVTAASLRPATRHLDFSFADRACLATATLAKVPVLTADRDWTKVDLGIKIILIR